jgi:outer membrane protein OmpA-like peptidoglycan-associated protein
MLADGFVLCLLALQLPAQAADPKPDTITATCTIEPAELEKSAARPIRIRMTAVDSQKHPLAYVWSGNGGVIEGVGAEIRVDSSGLSAGRYQYTGIVQDAYRNRAECAVEFRVMEPPEPLVAKCGSAQQQVEAGKPAFFDVAVAGAIGGPPRIQWFTNGGSVRGGSRAKLDTTGLAPAQYSVTARVEDDGGRATDCAATVNVLAAPPPPPDPDLSNLGQIVFPRNVGFMASADIARLEALAARIPTLGKGYVSVEAYAAPDERDAQKLAAARAAAVRSFLLGKGVAEGMIRVRVGLGGRLGGVRNRTLDMVWVPDGFSY